MPRVDQQHERENYICFMPGLATVFFLRRTILAGRQHISKCEESRLWIALALAPCFLFEALVTIRQSDSGCEAYRGKLRCFFLQACLHVFDRHAFVLLFLVQLTTILYLTCCTINKLYWTKCVGCRHCVFFVKALSTPYLKMKCFGCIYVTHLVSLGTTQLSDAVAVRRLFHQAFSVGDESCSIIDDLIPCTVSLT